MAILLLFYKQGQMSNTKLPYKKRNVAVFPEEIQDILKVLLQYCTEYKYLVNIISSGLSVACHITAFYFIFALLGHNCASFCLVCRYQRCKRIWTGLLRGLTVFSDVCR